MSIIVNNEPIETKEILDEMNRMRSEYEKVFVEMPIDDRENQLLEWAKENLIERILLKQHAAQDDKPLDPGEIDSAYQELLSNHKDEDAFLKAIQSKKEDIPKIKKDLELELRIKRLINDISENASVVSLEECRSYYDEHITEFTTPEQVHAAHIVKHVDANNSVEDAKKAILEVQTQMKLGTTFEELASENSDCPDQAGDLGWFPRGQMVERFENVVFNMDSGEISDVFQTEFGYHIVKLHEKRPKMPVPFENVQSQIQERLNEEQKNKEIEKFVDKARKTARISEYKDDQLDIEIERNKSNAWLTSQNFEKPLVNILVKPSGPDCNMACKYCFYLEKVALFGKAKHRMSDEILEEMVKQAMMQSGEHIGFGWQGGEPTLMGVDFFKKAVAFQKKYGKNQTVGNGLQTNGLLIDENWAEFLKENQFLVGLSLDGPQHIHDHYRRNAAGEPTWERVMQSAKLLLDRGIAVNALTVLSDYSVQFPEEIYNFHKDLGLNFMQFIPCVETDKEDSTKSAPFSVTPEAYGEFLCKIFDLWNNDFKNGQPTTSVRLFDSVFHSYVGFAPPECTLLEECGIYVVVEHNGDVYSCDFFVEPEWKLGNVSEGKLIEMLNSQKQKEFGLKKKEYHTDCKECQWLKYCRGGCTKDRVKDPRDQYLSHFCAAYKIFFSHADKRMQQLADQWKQNQVRAQAAVHANNTTRKISRNAPCPCGSGKKYKKCCEGKENQANFGKN